MILSYKFQDIGKIFEQRNGASGGRFGGFELDSGQSLPSRTNAYLEELLLVSTLTSIVMKHALEFKKANRSLFEMIVYLMTNRTVHLFKRENSSPDGFKAVSWLEMALEKIKIGQETKERVRESKHSRKILSFNHFSCFFQILIFLNFFRCF